MSRPIDADAFERDLKENLLPLLVEKYGKDEAMKGLHFSFLDCINNIHGQSTFVLPEPKWIPVSKRLPKENGFYLTSTMYGEVYLDAWNGINWERSEEILAWQPLPEPYREEG